MKEIHWDLSSNCCHCIPIVYKAATFILMVISVRAFYYLLSNYYHFYFAKKELKKLVLGPASKRYAVATQEAADHTGLGPDSHSGLGPDSHSGLGPVELPDAGAFKRKQGYSIYYHIIGTLKRVFSYEPGSPVYNLGMARLRERIDFLLPKGNLVFLMGLSTILLLGSFAYKLVRVHSLYQTFGGPEKEAAHFLLLNSGDYLNYVFVLFFMAILFSFWAYCNVGKYVNTLWILIADLETRHLQEGQHVNVVKETENEV
ncbi:MAG: hypothetical protein GY757_34335 [bacterium]|nr:hypothetical protein [bacterium]